MYSLILGGIICRCSTYIGFFLENRYKKCNKFLSTWLEYIIFAKQNITHLKKPISNINKEFMAVKKDEFIDVLKIFESEHSLTSLFENKNAKQLRFLDKQVQGELQIFFKQLGKFSLDTQLEQLEYYEKIVEQKQIISAKKLKNDGKLLLKLGLIIGVAIMIIVA